MATNISSLPPTMRAWTRPQRGPYRTSLHLTTLPTPSPPVGSEVLIKVSYVPLTPGALSMISLLPAFITVQDAIPELECSGTVVAAGPKAPTELRVPGTLVAAFRDVASLARGKGMLTEYVKIPAEMAVLPLPEGLRGRMKEVAALTSVGQTALKMIRNAGVKEGDVVLVNGASGGVGVMVVQLCKLEGARVVGIASGGNEDLVMGLGADEVSASVNQ
jgi:NADPH:quinone reductase-like Zn-dependent oxidoreductase